MSGAVNGAAEFGHGLPHRRAAQHANRFL